MNEDGWSAFHQTTVSRIEKGERPVRLGEARGIAQALGRYVGEMILPSDDARVLEKLEASVNEAGVRGRAVGEAVEMYMFEQTILRDLLPEARAIALDDSVDEWLKEKAATLLARAERRLASSYSDEISDYMEYLGKMGGGAQSITGHEALERWMGDHGQHQEEG
jgi:hypothetical protein